MASNEFGSRRGSFPARYPQGVPSPQARRTNQVSRQAVVNHLGSSYPPTQQTPFSAQEYSTPTYTRSHYSYTTVDLPTTTSSLLQSWPASSYDNLSANVPASFESNRNYGATAMQNFGSQAPSP